MISNKDMTILPGVAIATALMPPLCVVGLGLALGYYSVAFGGVLLFAANLIAINLAASVIFIVMDCTTAKGDPDDDEDEDDPAREYRHRRMLLSIALLVIISVPLSYFMYDTINTAKTESTIDTSLDNIIGTFNNVDLVNYTYELTDNTYYINLVARSDVKLSGSDIVVIENYLETELNKPTEVTMKIIFSADVDALTTVDAEEPVIAVSTSDEDSEASESTATEDGETTVSEDTEEIDGGTAAPTGGFSNSHRFLQLRYERR